MLKFLLLMCCFLAESYGYTTRIVNGTQAVLGEFPYIVSLQLQRDGRHIHNCGGSIIDATHILTAAHCLIGFDSFDYYAQYGVVDLEETKNRIKVSERVYHAGFSKTHGFFDIAIMTLEEPIQFDDNTAPATLADEWALTPENSPSVLAGWGLEETGGNVTRFLEKVDLVVYEDDKCEKKYKGAAYEVNSEIQVCSGAEEGGKGQCSGDSGGPLYADGVQIGVVSWSFKPCGQKGQPGVYSKVSMYRRWIDQQIEKQNSL